MVYGFFSKDEATDFNNDTADNNFKSFECKAKLLDNTVAQPEPNNTDGILKDATISVPLKHLNNFWRSLEMPLINCKIKLKFKWTMYFVLAVAAANNADANFNNIIFTCCHFISKRQPKTIKFFLAKDRKISVLEKI